MSKAPSPKAASMLAGIEGSNASETFQPHHTRLLIDAKQAAPLLCMSERKLWDLTKCGAIPSRKVGVSVRYSPAELSDWVAAGCPTEPGAGKGVAR